MLVVYTFVIKYRFFKNLGKLFLTWIVNSLKKFQFIFIFSCRLQQNNEIMSRIFKTLKFLNSKYLRNIPSKSKPKITKFLFHNAHLFHSQLPNLLNDVCVSPSTFQASLFYIFNFFFFFHAVRHDMSLLLLLNTDKSHSKE